MHYTTIRKRFSAPAAIALSLALVFGAAASPAAAWESKILCSAKTRFGDEASCQFIQEISTPSTVRLDIQVVESHTRKVFLGRSRDRDSQLKVYKIDKRGATFLLGEAKRGEGEWWVTPNFTFQKGESFVIVGYVLNQSRFSDITLKVEKAQW